MRQYPIWNLITACIYGSNKSYGVKETGEVEIRVGTSSKNSYLFLKHCTTHRLHENGDREFRFYVDQIILRRALFDNKNKTFNFIGTIPASINNYNPNQLELFK